MQSLIDIVIYPIQRLVVLLFSLQPVDGVSIGSLLVSALVLIIIYKAVIGLRLGGLADAGRRNTRARDTGGESE